MVVSWNLPFFILQKVIFRAKVSCNGIFYGNISLKVSRKIPEIPGGGSKTKVPPVCGRRMGINIF